MKVKKWKLASFLLPCLLLFALIYLAPMCMVFGSSFFEWKAGGVFKFIGLDNYINAFRNDARMLTALKNTGIWVVLQSVVHVMLGTVIAFMLSKRKKGWKVLRTIYMIPNVVSAAALAVIFLNVFNAQYGIINSFVKTVTGKPFMKNWFFDQNSAFITVTWSWLLYTGMIIILVLAGGSAYNIWLLKSYIDGLPVELDEAAMVDGANEFQVFYKIIIPLAMPQLAVIFLFSFIATYSEYVITSIFLQTPGKMTLALGLQSFISDQFAAHWTLFAAAAVISSLPIMIIFMCLQRFIQNGLVAGGVKG